VSATTLQLQIFSRKFTEMLWWLGLKL